MKICSQSSDDCILVDVTPSYNQPIRPEEIKPCTDTTVLKAKAENISINSHKVQNTVSFHTNGVKKSEDILTLTTLASKTNHRPTSSTTPPESSKSLQLNDSYDKPKPNVNNASNSVISSEPSDKVAESKFIKEFESFLDTCVECAKKSSDPRFKLIPEKVPILRECYLKCNPDFVKSKSFKKMLNSKIKILSSQPERVHLVFLEVHSEMKVRRLKILPSSEMTEKRKNQVDRLHTALRKLSRAIHKIEEAEVDWDADEEESPYLRLDAYRRRFVKVHQKLCELTGESVYAGRLTCRKLDYDKSSYPPINQALNKHFNKTKKFPTYEDVGKVIRDCIKEKKLNISDKEIEFEIRKNFEGLGDLIQRRRKHELQETLSDFLGTAADPADENPELQLTLARSYKEGQSRLNQFFEKYEKYQETATVEELAEDAIDSDSIQSESSTEN